MKGYKVFNPDWTCRGFQYEVGKTYEIEDTPILCEKGFHFCERLVDCFSYYKFAPDDRVAEIEAFGKVVGDDHKFCTNKITIVRELFLDEVLQTVNTGRGCTGLGNSGDYNMGYYNSGHYNSAWNNSGDCNSGNNNSGDRNGGWRNSGSYNAGNFNSGNGNGGSYNTGNFNSGTCNAGSFNSGNFNVGDFNATDYSNGCFNTQAGKIRIFNKESDWTLDDWRSSDACLILRTMPGDFKWVDNNNMTNEEKILYSEAKTTGGYLRKIDNIMRQEWWDSLTDIDKQIIKSIPNFDAEIFEKITGIKI